MYLLSLFNLRFSPFSSGHSLVKGNGVMCLVESAMVLTWYSLSSWFKKQTKKFILPTSLSPIGSVVGAGRPGWIQVQVSLLVSLFWAGIRHRRWCPFPTASPQALFCFVLFYCLLFLTLRGEMDQFR